MILLTNAIRNNADAGGAELDPEQAASLFKNVQKKMKNRAKPVAAWETSGRGLKGDPVHLMKECIKPNFPTNIQRELNDLDPETQKEIKALFD